MTEKPDRGDRIGLPILGDADGSTYLSLGS